MEYAFDTEKVSRAVRRYRLTRNGSPLRWSEALELWCADDGSFRLFFIALLKACTFTCFRFEAPPVTGQSTGRPFEFVVVDSPEIDLPADSRDFEAHFHRSADDITVFDNLGGDATMIVPRPREGTPGYPHIAGFVRHAPMAQQLQLWRTIGETLRGLLCDAPLWLNTAGGGVPWLHVRIDSRPKYYVFNEYRAPPDR